MLNLFDAIEVLGIIAEDHDKLFHQICKWHDLATPEVHHAPVHAIALRAPAILIDEHSRVDPPALVVAPQAVEHAAQAAVVGSAADRVFDPRADICDAHFQGGKSRTRPDVPPHFRGIFQQACRNHQIDGSTVLPVAFEPFRQSGARKLVENAEAVGTQSRIRAFPERRRGAQGEQVWQEIRDLVEGVDSDIVVLDADMHVHAANQQPIRDELHILLQHVIALFVRALLVSPACKGMGGCGDWGQPVLRREVRHHTPKAHDLAPHLRNRVADRSANFDLCAHKFCAEVALKVGFECLDEPGRRLVHQIAGFAVDE